MSGRGIVPPSGRGWSAPPSGRLPRSGTAALATRVVGRELTFGAVLWALRSGDYRMDIPAYALVLWLVIVAARRFGLARPSNWAIASKEGLIIFIGAARLANIIFFVFGLAPWFDQGLRTQ